MLPGLPSRPTTIAETGLDASLIQELALKVIVDAGTLSATAVSAQLRLPLSGVLNDLLTGLRRDGLIEVAAGATENARHLGGTGASGLVAGSALVFRPTEYGRARAHEAFERNAYVGPAPISFSDYCQMLSAQMQARPPIMRAAVRQRLSHLVLSDEVTDQVGVAVSRGGALFLWGHPGNGKTAIAEAIATMLGGGVFVPYAIEIRGQVVPVFDPSVHVAISPEGVDGLGRMDERWVLCQPPLVQAGGELALTSLDLQFNDRLRLYESPLQLKAAAGVLLIDDFGRQQCSPQELLNRWIVPLERGIDFVTLVNGQKVAVPFAALVVFSTNLRPADLVDEAFLRRVPNKIYVGDPTPEQYREILVRACRATGVAFSDTGFLYLLSQHYQQTRRSMRACHPRDLLRHVVALARYYGVPAELSPQMLDAAAHVYFLEDDLVRDSSATSRLASQQ
jgi:predicted ATPase with chaperone activity